MSISVQSLWIIPKYKKLSNTISQIEKMCILSFLKNNYEFHLYVYDLDINTGISHPNLKVLDARDILPESEIFQYKNGSYSAFSNLFRFKLLYMKGHIWVDMDVVCMKYYNFNTNTKYLLPGECDINYNQNKIGCSILKFPANDPILLDAINYVNLLKSDVLSGKIEWGIGPLTINYITTKYKLNSYVKYWWFCNAYCCHHFKILYDSTYNPISSQMNQKQFCIRDIYSVPEDMYFIHLYNEYFKRHNIDKNSLFDSDSLIGQLLTRYSD